MTSRNADDHWDEQEDVQVPVSRRTLLQTGALASAAVVPVGATGRAAGKPGNKGGLRARATVVDREDPDPDDAIVLAVLNAPIRDWTVYGDETVADQNPAFDPEEPLVIVAFEHRLDSGWADWRQATPDALLDGVIDRGIKFHAFPEARLERPRSKAAGEIKARTAVVDREDPDPDAAIVIDALEVPISDWTVYGDETVADHNPAYDPGEPVVIVAFEDRLETGWPNWRRANPNTLFDGVVERGIKFHAFPKGRLDRRRSKGR